LSYTCFMRCLSKETSRAPEDAWCLEVCGARGRGLMEVGWGPADQGERRDWHTLGLRPFHSLDLTPWHQCTLLLWSCLETMGSLRLLYSIDLIKCWARQPAFASNFWNDPRHYEPSQSDTSHDRSGRITIMAVCLAALGGFRVRTQQVSSTSLPRHASLKPASCS